MNSILQGKKGPNKTVSNLLVIVILVICVVFIVIFRNNYFYFSKDKPTDYTKAENWAYFGEGKGKDADLFLICPTVDMNDEYNMSLSDEKTKADFLGALNMERGIYEDMTRMYAPYYRQAAMKVYGLERDSWGPYLETAYRDISQAFDYYMKNENDGRPIILAGFSQGAEMCIRLLAQYSEDEEFMDKLIAVYAIGWPLTQDYIDRYPNIKAAEGEDDLGVVISFDCEAPEVSETFIYPMGQKGLSINPLNWKTDDTIADKDLNLGACLPIIRHRSLRRCQSFADAISIWIGEFLR